MAEASDKSSTTRINFWTYDWVPLLGVDARFMERLQHHELALAAMRRMVPQLQLGAEQIFPDGQVVQHYPVTLEFLRDDVEFISVDDFDFTRSAPANESKPPQAR